MAKNHELSVYFSTNTVLALCHAKRCTGFQMKDDIELESCRQINLVLLMPDEDKTFNGSLVLDVRIGWRHVHTLYTYAIKPLLQVHGEEKLLLPGTFS